ncbi:hypothetical protein GCM10009733_013540 [Nonomuraea maheshkhaliensis]|uniref:Uncharacterized protein n=1 Tax=Nonomuraea maheshkhaliensis TaxID=419590 RepID=A0ABP4QQ15_9ACTN
MRHLDNLEPALTTLMESRRISLRELHEDTILVCWDDRDGDGGLPVGRVERESFRRSGMFGRTVEGWTAYCDDLDHPGHDPILAGDMLPDLNQAVRAVLRHLPSRYS